MKNVVSIFLFNKKSGSIFAVFIVLLFVLGCLCTGRNQSTPLPAEYVGEWNGSDGSFLRIRPDGTADFTQGGTKIENSSVQIEGNKLRLKLLVTLKEFTIEQPPSNGRMKLSGVTYRNTAYRSEDTTDNNQYTTPDTQDENLTTEDKTNKFVETINTIVAEALVKDTLLDFNNAVQSEDFSAFHARASKPFRRQFTPQAVKSAFYQFVEKKEALDPLFQQVPDTKPTFTVGPKYSKQQNYETFVVHGYFPTTPNRIYFENEYLYEDGLWKLLKIKINIE